MVILHSYTQKGQRNIRFMRVKWKKSTWATVHKGKIKVPVTQENI